MTDEEIVAAWKARVNKPLPQNIRMPDGRIDADVAFGHVFEMMKTMTPLEFRAMNRLAGNE